MNPNPQVSEFLDQLQHPLRAEIELLRTLILETNSKIEENIKWNGPNYSVNGEDRITMKIQPPKIIQLIFHRGAKKLEQPIQHLIEDPFRLLDWKENDRAVIGFKSVQEIHEKEKRLTFLIYFWVKAI